MTPRLRRGMAALIAALALVIAPVLTATSASAAEPVTTNTLFFSRDGFTDIDQEDLTMIAGLTDSGIVVTVFDGGDGSAAAWVAALAGNGVLVIPETSSSTPVWTSGGTSAMSDEAAAAVLAFVTAGGTVILGGSENEQLLSYLTGIDYDGNWNDGGTAGPWDLQIVEPALPAQLTNSNGTYPIDSFGTWSAELLAGVIPLYTGDSGAEMAAGKFPVGAGFVYSFAYDWYPGDETEDIDGRVLWNQLLVWAATGTAGAAPAAPALADTGLDTTILWTGALGLMMLGVAGVLVARTRKLEQL